MARTAVILMNLGGPDSPDAVRPFLKNLFSDPAILRVPAPVRWMLARLISARRAPVAQKIYAEIGGRSPILPETEKQAAALGEALGSDYKIFIAMRYWHPMSDETAEKVKAYKPDQIVLLPLYPQYSTATTESSLNAWRQAAEIAGLGDIDTVTIESYPDIAGLVSAEAALISDAISKTGSETIAGAKPVRLMFSAHGIPVKFVRDGDPYQQQIERTVRAVLDRLGPDAPDHVICYQSRVGRLEWLGPYAEDEIRRAGADGASIVLVPISFVSEHSETLVELDIEYRALAMEAGVGSYVRVPAVSTHPDFIGALADLVRGNRGEELDG